MDVLKLRECRGYTRQEAFKGLAFNPDPDLVKGTNCTQAWTQQGRPTPGTMPFRRFAIQQLQEKTMLKPGYGLYITLENPVPDIRKRPYTLISNKVTSARQWGSTQYMIIEADLSINNIPNREVDIDGEEITTDESVDITVLRQKEVVAVCPNLAEAHQEMKRLTAENHKDYIALAVKIPDKFPIITYSIYTPSSNAKIGRFLAFGIDAEVND